jgi:hypothetical protein
MNCDEIYTFLVNDRGTPDDELDDISVPIRQCTRF